MGWLWETGKGFGGAIYKSFSTEAEARAFVEDSGLSLSDFMSAKRVNLNRHKKWSLNLKILGL